MIRMIHVIPSVANLDQLVVENLSSQAFAYARLLHITTSCHRASAPIASVSCPPACRNRRRITSLKKLSFDEFHAFVDVALWSPLDADKVLRVSADGAVEQVEPEIEIMGEEKVQRSKRGGTERVPEAGD